MLYIRFSKLIHLITGPFDQQERKLEQSLLSCRLFIFYLSSAWQVKSLLDATGTLLKQ